MNLTVVEFISTPGAGKTTLLPAVKRFFASHGLRAWTILEAARPFARRAPLGRLVGAILPPAAQGPLLWQVFYQASRLKRAEFQRQHRELLDSVLRFQRTRPLSRADRRHVLGWFLNLTGQYQFLTEHARPGEVLVLDEGFVHRVVQLFASETETARAADLRSYLGLIPVPSLVIHPRASLATCLQRVHRRGVWERFAGRGDEVVARFMDSAHAAVGLAVEQIHAQGWPMLAIDNEGIQPQEAARRLEQDLAALSTPLPAHAPLPQPA